MSLELITKLSNKYGSDPDYVLAGGGNTSYKDEKYLYVKPSGVSLAAIKECDFVKMDRAIVRSCFTLDNFASVDEREAKVKKLMDFACETEGRRPSVEAPMQEIMAGGTGATRAPPFHLSFAIFKLSFRLFVFNKKWVDVINVLHNSSL